MAWTKPAFTKGKIDRAGYVLSLENPFMEEGIGWDEYLESIEIVNNWRAVHSYPLHAMKMTLKRRAKGVCGSAIVAQRLKRLASIRLKLRLSRAAGNHPSLSQMQDIGGCRAVLDNVDQVRKIEAKFLEASRKNPNRGAEHSRTFDYISNPKESGYRSLHLVYRFRSDSPEHSCYNGQRIEIQLRSRQQHYWATAVETYSTFSGEALKSNIGPDEWKRFFALVASLIAIYEQQPSVPGTPSRATEIIPELKELYQSLNVFNVLSGWSAVSRFAEEGPSKETQLYLVMLDPKEFRTTLLRYKLEEAGKATAEYGRIEKERPDIQAVLVSVDSIAALHAAYPNYFLDTRAFLEILMKAVIQDV